MARSTIVPRALTRQQLSRLRQDFERQLAKALDALGLPLYCYAKNKDGSYSTAIIRTMWTIVQATALSQYQKGYRAARNRYQPKPSISIDPSSIKVPSHD